MSHRRYKPIWNRSSRHKPRKTTDRIEPPLMNSGAQSENHSPSSSASRSWRSRRGALRSRRRCCRVPLVRPHRLKSPRLRRAREERRGMWRFVCLPASSCLSAYGKLVVFLLGHGKREGEGLEGEGFPQLQAKRVGKRDGYCLPQRRRRRPLLLSSGSSTVADAAQVKSVSSWKVVCVCDRSPHEGYGERINSFNVG